MRYRAWRLHDHHASGAARTYEFPINPNAMTSPFPERNIAVRSSTAIDGRPLLFEGARPPATWQFSGSCPTADQYEALRSWVYDHIGRTIYVDDHFGRSIECVLTSFNPEPRRDVNRYWHHTYQINAIVLTVARPIVGEVWR